MCNRKVDKLGNADADAVNRASALDLWIKKELTPHKYNLHSAFHQ